MFGIFRKILGMKQNASDKLALGRKMLNTFNNSMGVKFVRTAGQYIDSMPIIEQTLNKVPFGKYIPQGIRIANKALDKAQDLERYADTFAKTTGMGLDRSGA